MSAARVAELRRLVAEAETNAGVEALIAAARKAVGAWEAVLTIEDDRLGYAAMTVAIDRLEELVGRTVMAAFNPRNKQPSVAAAWRAYRTLMSPTTERDELAFWAGASVMLLALLESFDEGDEVTPEDERKMRAIHDEVDRFCQTFDQRAIAILWPGRVQ